MSYKNSCISVFSVAKIEYVIINSNWMHEIMAGQKKKPRYSSESPWFPEYYIGWMGISNCSHETSTTYYPLFMLPGIELNYLPISFCSSSYWMTPKLESWLRSKYVHARSKLRMTSLVQRQCIDWFSTRDHSKTTSWLGGPKIVIVLTFTVRVPL